ncbi:hypothetical protein WS67_19455 [Burkholderia singularis]|uniref:Uncharacterized protein n=1 Tax=Burkholderia singularis TaxID=1503053 RepID=A0A103DYI2_9BURK|nr:hypothetical protein WS67_19455 [Burkholderia singularis]SMF99582.1 hypothetical protein BSIN_2765 [Burkholderia singularis]
MVYRATMHNARTLASAFMTNHAGVRRDTFAGANAGRQNRYRTLHVRMQRRQQPPIAMRLRLAGAMGDAGYRGPRA